MARVIQRAVCILGSGWCAALFQGKQRKWLCATVRALPVCALLCALQAAAVDFPATIRTPDPATVVVGQKTSVAITVDTTAPLTKPLLRAVSADGKHTQKLCSLTQLQPGLLWGSFKAHFSKPGTVLLEVAHKPGAQIVAASDRVELYVVRGDTKALGALLESLPPEPAQDSDHPVMYPMPADLGKKIITQEKKTFGTEDNMLVALPHQAAVSAQAPRGGPKPPEYDVGSAEYNRAVTKRRAELLDLLQQYGVNIDLFSQAASVTVMHSDGEQAGGLLLKRTPTSDKDVFALTINRVPGYQRPLVGLGVYGNYLPYFTNTGATAVVKGSAQTNHIILRSDVVAGFLGAGLPSGDRLSFEASTLVHELIHVIEFEQGAKPSNEEALAYPLEEIINLKFGIGVATSQSRDPSAYQQRLNGILAELWHKEPGVHDLLTNMGFGYTPTIQMSTDGPINYDAVYGQPTTVIPQNLGVHTLDLQTGQEANGFFHMDLVKKDGFTQRLPTGNAVPGFPSDQNVSALVGSQGIPIKIYISIASADGTFSWRDPGTYSDSINIYSYQVAEGNPGSPTNPLVVPVQLIVFPRSIKCYNVIPVTPLSAAAGYAWASGLNNKGTVVGVGGPYACWSWTAKGGLTEILTLTPGGINDNNIVAGNMKNPPDAQRHAGMYDLATGNITDLGTGIPTSDSNYNLSGSNAWRINNNNLVLGSAAFLKPAGNTYYGQNVYTATATWQGGSWSAVDLDWTRWAQEPYYLGPDYCLAAIGLNDSGLIVGAGRVNGNSYACIFQNGAVLNTLGGT
ncbi:MAG: hypothetical protein ABSE73_24030, partial [Planctomycetota bacterium]